MLSLQEVGSQILTGNPGKFYVFTGTEYGVKDKYLEHLYNHYGTKVEAPSVSDVLNMMKTKRMIPLQPTVYVVRYDEAFVGAVTDATAGVIKSTNIIGTIVCLYEQPKHAAKMAKYLPNYTVAIDAVNPKFVRTYLHSDFPNTPDRFIDIAVNCSANYGHAKNIVRCMNAVPVDELYSLSDSEISKIFGCSDVSTEMEIKKGVASRNFSYLIDVLSQYEGDPDSILYAILSTLLEIDSAMDNSRRDTFVREYVKRWSRQDIYYMFVATYEEIKRMRSSTVAEPMNRIIYLLSLLQFSPIPDPEVLQ